MSGTTTPTFPRAQGQPPVGVELLSLSLSPSPSSSSSQGGAAVRFTQRYGSEGEEEEAELARGPTLSVQLVTVSIAEAYGAEVARARGATEEE